jgi:hypothetical protein
MSDPDFERLEYLLKVFNSLYYDSAVRLENRLVVDTDILIDHLRGIEKAKEFLMEIENKTYTAFISVITKVELLSGRKDERVLELFEILHTAPLSDEIVALAGDLRRKYKIGFPDALIAATAITLNAELVTRNLKHYEMIEELVIKDISE